MATSFMVKSEASSTPSDGKSEVIERAWKLFDDRKELPLDVYGGEDIHRLELDNIFQSGWEFIGHESEIPEPGDYHLRYIGNDQHIFSRGESGGIFVLFNSCAHRGSMVCRTEKGNTSHFRCPYHGWTYKTNGELVGVPFKDKMYPDVDREDRPLRHAPRVESVAGFVFASLDPDVEPLDEYLGEEYLRYLESQLQFTVQGMEVIGDPQRNVFNANWKTATENNLGDDYHVHITHRSTVDAKMIDNPHSSIAETTEPDESAADRDWQNPGWTTADVNGHPVFCNMDYEGTEISDEYPDSVKDNVLSAHEENIKVTSTSHGLVFPNFVFIHKINAGYLVIYKYRPLASGKTEKWTWILAPKEASPEYKKKAYRAGSSREGTAGAAEIDDIAVWEGIAETGRSGVAKRRDRTVTYDSIANEDDEWPYPGEGYEAYNDVHSWLFFEEWFAQMRDGGPV